MTTLQSLTVKTPDQIRDDYLRTYANCLKRRGIAQPNISDGTEIYVRATALAQQIYAASVATPAVANAQMPDSAQNDDLVRVAAQYGLALRPASGSVGALTLAASVSAPIGIVAGQQLIDPNGLAYQVSVGGQYTVGGTNVPIASVDTGPSTNLLAGTVLRWVAPPPYVQPTALVASPGLSEGKGSDTYEDLRARLLERLANPPNGSNWSTATSAAEDASSAVQKAFAYQACNGPGTLHLAVVAAAAGSNYTRVVDPFTMTNVVVPAVQAQYTEGIELVVTSVQDLPTSVSFSMSLPAAQTATPPGPGGGWTDAAPWPTPPAAATQCTVTAVSSNLAITVSALNAPVASSSAPGITGSTICWVSPNDYQLYTAHVVTSVDTSGYGAGPWSVTLDGPFADTTGATIPVGAFVFPDAVNMQTYVDAILAGFGAFGPGEKTNLTSLLPRASRRPVPQSAWPYSLNAAFLKNLTNSGQEVYDAGFLWHQYTTPPLPSAISQAPYILTPANLAIYPE